MGNYMDKTYTAADGVLLFYGGEDVSLRLPRRLANMAIRVIGEGACMESSNLRQVVVPDGVQKIGASAFCMCKALTAAYLPNSVEACGAQAFFGCPNLGHIYLYNLALSAERYRELKESARSADGSVYMTSAFPSDQKLLDIVRAACIKPAASVRDGIARLFTSQNAAEEKGTGSLERNLDGIRFDRGDRDMTESEAFLALIADPEPFAADENAEEKNDRFMKTDQDCPLEKTAVFSFDDSKTKVDGGTYTVVADIRIGFHFWQSKLPITVSGKTYYLYRRHYLSSDPKLNYVRKDVAIFTENGPVFNRREASAVYAKYRLLSIL